MGWSGSDQPGRAREHSPVALREGVVAKRKTRRRNSCADNTTPRRRAGQFAIFALGKTCMSGPGDFDEGRMLTGLNLRCLNSACALRVSPNPDSHSQRRPSRSKGVFRVPYRSLELQIMILYRHIRILTIECGFQARPALTHAGLSPMRRGQAGRRLPASPARSHRGRSDRPGASGDLACPEVGTRGRLPRAPVGRARVPKVR
jgi:hypothetical protein